MIHLPTKIRPTSPGGFVGQYFFYKGSLHFSICNAIPSRVKNIYEFRRLDRDMIKTLLLRVLTDREIRMVLRSIKKAFSRI